MNLDLVLKNEWHYLICMEGHGGREVTLRHDQLVQLLAHYLKLAGAAVVLEPKHVFSETNKRPDLQVVLGSKVYLIDITIVNPTAPSNLRHSQKVLGQASAAEKAKIRKYGELSIQQNCNGSMVYSNHRSATTTISNSNSNKGNTTNSSKDEKQNTVNKHRQTNKL